MIEQVAFDKVRDFIINMTAEQTGMDPKVIEKIIMFQFKDAFSTFKEATEIQVASMGRFIFSSRKARNRIKRMETKLEMTKRKVERERAKEITTEPRKEFIGRYEQQILKSIEYLNDKIEFDRKRDEEMPPRRKKRKQ